MKTGATAGEKEIQTTGFFVFGALTLIRHSLSWPFSATGRGGEYHYPS